jgi:hypothetical protein
MLPADSLTRPLTFPVAGWKLWVSVADPARPVYTVIYLCVDVAQADFSMPMECASSQSKKPMAGMINLGLAKSPFDQFLWTFYMDVLNQNLLATLLAWVRRGLLVTNYAVDVHGTSLWISAVLFSLIIHEMLQGGVIFDCMACAVI